MCTPSLFGTVGFRKCKKSYNDLNCSLSVNIIFRMIWLIIDVLKSEGIHAWFESFKTDVFPIKDNGLSLEGELSFHKKPPFEITYFNLEINLLKVRIIYKPNAFVKSKAV